MNQSAAAEVFVAPAPELSDLPPSKHLARTHETVVAAAEASLHGAIESAGWRRGFLQKLVRDREPEAIKSAGLPGA
jgi:hypothetical protein